jgi:hypothetical protein
MMGTVRGRFVFADSADTLMAFGWSYASTITFDHFNDSSSR